MSVEERGRVCASDNPGSGVFVSQLTSGSGMRRLLVLVAATLTGVAMNETTARVWVPSPNAPEHSPVRMVDPASAIVSVVRDGLGDDVVAYFESNRFDSEQGSTYVGRVLLAVGRAAERYPTVARTLIPRSRLVEVGSFDLASNHLDIWPDKLDLLRAYLGAVPLA